MAKKNPFSHNVFDLQFGNFSPEISELFFPGEDPIVKQLEVSLAHVEVIHNLENCHACSKSLLMAI